MPKKHDFEKQECQIGEMKKTDLHSLHSLSGGNGRRYTGEQCDTVHECNRARCDDVEGHCAQRTTRYLAVTRNTTQQLQNTKHCTLECCVGLHILWQVVYVGDRSSCLR